MNTKEKILKFLEENRDDFISGEDMAKKLNISRTAIWKGVNSLRDQGFVINSSTNKGYQIDKDCDKISEFGIKHNLSDELKKKDIDVIYYDSIDSTNTEMKRRLYSEKLNNYTVIVADEQTGGRGRRGRDFLSPKGSGIYFSIVLFPEDNFDMSSFDLVTVRAAVAVAKSINEITDKEAKIKWVNDVFVDGKKVCGILSEADSDFENMHIKSIIVGIGINFSTKEENFGELKNKAGSINPKGVLRSELCAKIISNFYDIYYHQSKESVLDYYTKYSNVINQEVEFELNSKKYNGIAESFDEKGNLIVKLDDSSEMTLSSGEISIRGDFYR